MKPVSLNLEDKQSQQKLHHVLTSFASDYIDLVAAEQMMFTFEAQVLTVAFNLLGDGVSDNEPKHQRLNEFTRRLTSHLERIEFIGTRRIQIEFFMAAQEEPRFRYGVDVAFIPVAVALARKTNQGGLKERSRGGAVTRKSNPVGRLVGAVKGWLLDPATLQAAQTTGRLAVRDPKGLLVAAKDQAVLAFNQSLNWVDTFPWENWAQNKKQQLRERYQRNLWRSVVEDVAILVVLVLSLMWLTEHLSGPGVNLAGLPNAHIDNNMTVSNYRCGNPGLTRKNYVCLKEGMSYEQVANILGSEGKPLGINEKFSKDCSTNKSAKTCAVVMNWHDGNSDLNATFLDNKLLVRAYQGISY